MPTDELNDLIAFGENALAATAEGPRDWAGQLPSVQRARAGAKPQPSLDPDLRSLLNFGE